MQVNEKKKKICETQKKYKKASSGSCCGRCFFGILIVAGIEYGCNIQEKNMGNLQNSYVKLDKVSKIYKMGEVEIRAVDNISFEISKGEFVVVVGPSGAGKTTVLNILGGMDTATEGDVYVDGSNIAEYNSHQLTAYRRDDIGFVFQFYNLVPNLTALENVELAMQKRSSAKLDWKTVWAISLHSYPAVNSREFRSQEPLQRIRSFFCVMNRQGHLTIRQERQS